MVKKRQNLVNVVCEWPHANYGLSIITSKSLSKNLNNQIKHFCFLLSLRQNMNWMPKWTIFVISSQVLVLITEIFWRTFWHNSWQSKIDVVERLCFIGQNKFDRQTKTNKWHFYFRNHITHIVTDQKNWPKGIYKYFCVLYQINTIREYFVCDIHFT